MSEKKFSFDISSATLHILAMFFMLMDHSWATIAMRYEWLTCVGRMAFPIFAFMLVEGFCHTHNLKKYLLRMLIFAVISEIPFDYMYGGNWFYPYHQNVMWTFLLALLCLKLVDILRAKKTFASWVLILLIVVASVFLGFATMVDYYGTGILLIYVFYFFRGKKWWCYLGQFIGMYIVNVSMLGGYYYPINIFGFEIELVQQAIAMLALIPIWLYKGRQGFHNKIFQYFCYAFYPLHIAALVIIGMLQL